MKGRETGWGAACGDGKESGCCNAVPYENCIGSHKLMIVTSITAVLVVFANCGKAQAPPEISACDVFKDREAWSGNLIAVLGKLHASHRGLATGPVSHILVVSKIQENM